MSRLGRAALALALACTVVACANAERPSVQADAVTLPTPVRSLTPAMAAGVAAVDSAVMSIGERVVQPQRAYRPSEPSGLLQLPRTIVRADLADPDDGYVVIYGPAPGEATDRAEELAAYLESGFGQTNYPVDAQFSVATLGDVVLFTSWSRARSADPERAEAVFDAVARVGQAIEVRK